MKKPSYLSALVAFGWPLVALMSRAAQPVPATSVHEQLSKVANMTSAEIAAEVDKLKAERAEQKAGEAKAHSTPDARGQLRQRFQREFAAAKDEETRERLVCEYIVNSRVLAAREELARQEARKAKKDK